MWIIYMHKNKINGKVYIGQTRQDPQERWRNGNGYKSSVIFFKAIQKYGWDNFEHIIIEKDISTREEANEREKYWIKFYDCCVLDGKDKGYNSDRGGKGFSKELAIFYNKKNWANPEYKAKFEKPIICINNQKIYKSIIEASNQTGINKTGIAKACSGVHKSAGKDKDGKPMVWAYYEKGKEYVYSNPALEDKKLKKVICVTTGEIFNSITEAENKYNVSNIGACASGKYKSAGQLPDGTRLCWEYYDETKQYKKRTVLGKSHKKVICLNNGLIFDTIKEGAEYAKRNASNLSAHLHGRGKSCGIDKNGNKLIWAFYDEDE